MAEYIKQKWQNEYGIKTQLIRYKVLLSSPSPTKRSSVCLLTSKGEVMFITQATEKAVEVSEKQGKALPPFAAYSTSGNVTVRKNPRHSKRLNVVKPKLNFFPS